MLAGLTGLAGLGWVRLVWVGLGWYSFSALNLGFL